MIKKLTKLTVLTLALAASIALPVSAQNTTNSILGNLPSGTNLITGGSALLDQVTNIAFVGYGVYNKDSHKVGGGIMAIYNVNNYIGTGLGLEALGNNIQVLSGNVELKMETHPLKFLGWDAFTAIPWAGVFMGTPLGGTGNANGQLSAGAGGGVYVKLADIGKGWSICGGAGATQWTGAGKDFNGLHILGFLSFNHGI